jgi:hypothetical protein
MATALISPAEVEKFVPLVVSQAEHLAVKSPDEYEYACTFLQFVATRKKQVDEVFDPIVTKAHAAHKEAVAQKKKFMDPLVAAEISVKGKVSMFRMEQERIRRAEEQRIADEAKKEADERALAEATALEASGDSDLADMVLQNAAEAPAPVVVLESSVPKQDGISKRVNWRYEVVDETKVPREFMVPSDLKIGAVVRSQKGLTKIPGVRVWSEETVSVRSR